jgi:nitroimidazol reductase NimA-like FMN-containing flavoprotein (pyridoxamine 5'-phosphate oxidase superfamily)
VKHFILEEQDMSDSFSLDELTAMRRADRAITDDAEIADLLRRADICRIATSINDQPFINANTFWYDGECIFFHTATEGRTLTNIRQNPRVCLEVDWHGRWLPAKTAMEFSVEYTGVVVFGRARLLEDAAEKERALQGLLDKYFPDLRPGVDYRPTTPEELAVTAVFAIEVEAWSGKREVAPPGE